MSAAELFALFLHFATLSMLATGGAIALASDMHRYVVEQHGYLTHTEFVNSIALAQAAPGPNILFVTVMGWQVDGLRGALATTLGLAVPAFVYPFLVSRLGRRERFQRALVALERGLGPLAVGLMASTCYVLAREVPGGWKGLAIIAAATLLLSTTRLPPLVPILAAGALGAFIPW